MSALDPIPMHLRSGLRSGALLALDHARSLLAINDWWRAQGQPGSRMLSDAAVQWIANGRRHHQEMRS